MRKPPTPTRLGGIDLIAQDAVNHAHASVMWAWDTAIGDSPIEKLFFTALVVLCDRGERVMGHIMVPHGSRELEGIKELAEKVGHGHNTIIAEKQIVIAGWRVDFVLHYPAWVPGTNEKQWARLLVECDGHDFHERTKKQAARDRSRDRVAQHEGLAIFRFTGSELWNDPLGCADEVLAFMER